MNRTKLERKISRLQNLLSRHNPMPPIIYIERDTDGKLIVPTTGETLPFVKPIEHNEPPFVEPEPELTDIPEDEINQREEEQKLLEEKLAQIELDKLVKKKPRVKKT